MRTLRITDLEEELGRIYGKTEGHRVYQTIIPGILADFLKMVGKASVGKRVKEEYHLEDGRGTIILETVKTSGMPDIRAELRR